MLLAITLLIVGFASGVLLTAIIAVQIYGLLHAEAAQVVDANLNVFGGVTLRTHLPMQAPIPSVGTP